MTTHYTGHGWECVDGDWFPTEPRPDAMVMIPFMTFVEVRPRVRGKLGQYGWEASDEAKAEARKLLATMLGAKNRPGDGSHRRFDGALEYERQALATGTWVQLNGGPNGDPSYQLHLEPPTHVGLWLMDGVEEE